MNTYSNQLAQLAEDFINTFDLYLDQPEHLQQPEDLHHFLAAHGIETTMLTWEHLAQAHALRNVLRSIWTAADVPSAVELLNPLLAKVNTTLRLAQDAEQYPYLQYDFGLNEVVSRLGAECALGIVATLQAYGLERMRACASEPCRDVFVDTSRNGTRRFCSDRCANRYNINTFRKRQKGSEDE